VDESSVGNDCRRFEFWWLSLGVLSVILEIRKDIKSEFPNYNKINYVYLS
jgi:hypothetical protein